MSNCSVSVSNGVFGDPCEGKLKYLAVIHRCYSGNLLNGYGDWTIGQLTTKWVLSRLKVRLDLNERALDRIIRCLYPNWRLFDGTGLERNYMD